MSSSELLDLLRRLPPQNVSANLAKIVDILGGPADEVADELLSSIDQPLKVLSDPSGREFLACDFNRDSLEPEEDGGESTDAYRSPWTNDYVPALPDGTRPSPRLRVLEQAANEAFSVYREMYYEGTGVSSVYLWDLEAESGASTAFAGVVLLKKTNKTGAGLANWDSIHVFEAAERSRAGNYKLTSTVMLYMTKASSPTIGNLELGGSMTRQVEQTLPLDSPPSSSSNGGGGAGALNPSHIANLGRMIEEQEAKMRNLLQEVYFAKTRDVVNDLRSIRGAAEESQRKGLQGELVGLLRGRQ